MNAIVKFRLCTLSDAELIEKIDEKVDSLYKERFTDSVSRGRHISNVISRHIPARPNEDFDLLIGELLVRFKIKKRIN